MSEDRKHYGRLIGGILAGGLAFLLLFVGLFWCYLKYCNEQLYWGITSSISAHYESKIFRELSEANGGLGIGTPDNDPPYQTAWEGTFFPALRSITIRPRPSRNESNQDLRFRDLSPLKECPLYYADVSGYPSGVSPFDITDLSPLRGLPLKGLILRYNPNLSDLSPLRGILTLEELFLDGTWVENLDALRGMRLHTLSLDHTLVKDLTPLQGMDLEELSIIATPAAKLPLPEGIRVKNLIK